MAGERDLGRLLRHMTPQLQPCTFVFCSFPDSDLPAGLAPIATFREAEGLSAILTLDEARLADVPWQFESNLITLTIHSSLEAVGFLAAVSAVLAEAGIPCNAVAAFHHDHLFVPRDMAQRALALLTAAAAAPARSPARIRRSELGGASPALARHDNAREEREWLETKSRLLRWSLPPHCRRGPKQRIRSALRRSPGAARL